jgi:hypothetical protein
MKKALGVNQEPLSQAVAAFASAAGVDVETFLAAALERLRAGVGVQAGRRGATDVDDSRASPDCVRNSR